MTFKYKLTAKQRHLVGGYALTMKHAYKSYRIIIFSTAFGPRCVHNITIKKNYTFYVHLKRDFIEYKKWANFRIPEEEIEIVKISDI